MKRTTLASNVRDFINFKRNCQFLIAKASNGQGAVNCVLLHDINC